MDTQLTLTMEIEKTDKFDEFLLEEILMIVQNKDILSVVSFWGYNKSKSEKINEVFYKKIMLAVNALIKANALRRNYYHIKDEMIEKIEQSSDIKNTNIDMLFNKVDAFILIEGFFVQIKTSLDLLAQSLEPIYGIKSHTWGEKKGLSGQAIVDMLNNNLSIDTKMHAQPLINLIDDNKVEITQIVRHRNDTVHYGKLNKVQGFRFSFKDKKVIAPLILVNEKESDYVHKYLDEALDYIASFTQSFIITILSNLIPDMIVSKRSDNTWGLSTAIFKH